MIKQTFINLPVENLKRAIKFFTQLGFSFNPQFTDEKATCMIIGENMFVMLLVKDFFKSFTPGKVVAQTLKNVEVIVALSVESKAQVDEMLRKVVAAGGQEYREASDHGWMYARAFQDLDGHVWEIFYMDEKNMPAEMKNKKSS